MGSVRAWPKVILLSGLHYISELKILTICIRKPEKMVIVENSLSTLAR
jgi:hypothetical protein